MSDTDRLERASMDATHFRASMWIRLQAAAHQRDDALANYDDRFAIFNKAEKAENEARTALDTALYEEARA